MQGIYFQSVITSLFFRMNDVIVKVNDDNVVNVTHSDAVDALKRAGTRVVLVSLIHKLGRVKPMRAAKVQASLRIRAVSPEPSLLAHTSSESRGTFRQKARSLAPLNGWACAVEICHDGMLQDTNSLDGAQLVSWQKGS